MTKTFRELGNSLKEFILDAQTDAHNVIAFSARRYNNLKLSMNPKRERKPHIVVTIGMSEATFSLPDGEKLSGGLGIDERMTLRWLGRANVLEELNDLWKSKNSSKIDLSQREDDEDE